MLGDHLNRVDVRELLFQIPQGRDGPCITQLALDELCRPAIDEPHEVDFPALNVAKEAELAVVPLGVLQKFSINVKIMESNFTWR